MHNNNLYLYPVNPFFSFGQYPQMVACFEPVFEYNPSYQKCEIPALPPVENISNAFKPFENPQIILEAPQKPQKKHKVRKIASPSPNALKAKNQKIFLKIAKTLKTPMIQQKQGRNSNSNLLRMFFRRLQNKIEDTPHHIQNLIAKYNMKISLQEFVGWIQTNKVDHRNYIRVPTIRKFFIEQQFVREHTRIMRILFKDFIDTESINCYLTSKKVRRHVMSHNFHSIRTIFDEVFGKKPTSP